MKKVQDAIVTPLSFTPPDKKQEDEKVDEPIFESLTDFIGVGDENPLYDPSLKDNFFRNTSNRDAYNEMISFDEQEVEDSCYEIIERLLDGVIIDVEDKNTDIPTEVNRHFSTIINNYHLFKEYRNVSNLLTIIFLCFCEVVDCDSFVVFKNLSKSYQDILKSNLIKNIGEEQYKIFEKRSQMVDEKPNTINNHDDVVIRTIL